VVQGETRRGVIVSPWTIGGETADMDMGSVLICCLPIIVSMENLEMSPFGFETKLVWWL